MTAFHSLSQSPLDTLAFDNTCSTASQAPISLEELEQRVLDGSVSVNTSSLRSSQTAPRPSGGNPSAFTSRPARRRIRPKIALDPDQPPTARGKPRARVYVACDQCRIRKTRCDGAKPVCYNCRKRPPEDGECSYEAQPKRRGQDKVPGIRVRSSASEKPAKRKRISSYSGPDESDVDSSSRGSQGSSSDESTEEYDPFPLVDLDPPNVEVEYYPDPILASVPAIPSSPSLQFTRDTWWDALLTFYSAEDGSTADITLLPEQRSSTMQHVVADLRALFHSSIYWVSFLHLPRFFENLLNPTKRALIQPSLVLSALAIGVYAQSSEAERGPPGRAKALKLLDLADSSLQASLASGWVDIGLIQAAWLIAYFELQSHPARSCERNRSSMLLLDSLIRLFSLTTLDADVKRARWSHQPATRSFLGGASYNSPPMYFGDYTNPFYTGASAPRYFSDAGALLAGQNVASPPIASPIPPANSIVPDNITLAPSTTPPPAQCNCMSLTLQRSWPGVLGVAPSFSGSLMWPENVPESEFRKEECRRLVWASVMMTASLNSYTSVLDDIEKNRLWIKNPANYALLFPGESLAQSGAQVLASNIWTLSLRSMLLLHTCVSKRGDVTLSDADRAQFAMHAWLEIDAIENVLDQHTCAIDSNFGFQTREMLFSSRMCISHEFQRYIPQVTTNGSRLFYRDKAETWLRHRLLAAERVWQNQLAEGQFKALEFRKPLFIYWFMSHVIKALVLWEADPTLTVALDVSKIFAKRTEHLMMFWPSAEQRQEWQDLRYRLVEACLKSGISPPESTLPASISRKPEVK